MKRERYSIIYSSKTGNTKKLAEAIYNALPQNKCDYYGTVDKIDDVLSNVIYIGFWTEKGNADHLTIDFLNKLKNKKIFLFGTAGYGESEKYFEGIINNVKKNIDSSNTIIGTFMCQGKMPLSRYIDQRNGFRQLCTAWRTRRIRRVAGDPRMGGSVAVDAGRF